MKVLITGITGMVGSHLAEFIRDNHSLVEVHGLIRWRSPLDNIKNIYSKITLHQAELRDLNSLITLMQKIKPDRIFHLAAQSYVTTSFDAPAEPLAQDAGIFSRYSVLDWPEPARVDYSGSRDLVDLADYGLPSSSSIWLFASASRGLFQRWIG